MPPVLGGAATMAVLPASPQTATQGNPHPHSQGQTQPLLSGNEGGGGAGGSAGGSGIGSGGIANITGVGVASQANAAAAHQPQLLYQPYNLMPADSPSQGTASPPTITQRAYTHTHRHRYNIYPHDGQQSESLPDSGATLTAEERREAEVREQEKREREFEARMERDRLEKQRVAQEAVHQHFEESLRLAQQKVSYAPQRNMQSASMAWNSFIPIPPPGSRSHGAPPTHTGLTAHGASHHHPSGSGGAATHSVTVVQQQQQQQQQREREERDAREREREAQIREREQREREREHLAVTERLHRQAEARDHAARAAYYASATPPTAQQVLRPSSISGKVEYPPPPAHSRTSKSSLPVTGHHEKPPPTSQVVGPPHSALPKAEPNVSLFSYSTYQPQNSYMHDMKVKNDMQHKSIVGKGLGNVMERDHHAREMLPNPPPLLPDHKGSSVIVKNDGRDLQQKVSSAPHSSSPKMMSYLSVQSVAPPLSTQQQQQQQQHKTVAYEYRSPTQSPHLHHLDSLQAAKGMSPQVGHHGRGNSGQAQLPPSPHGHPSHPHNRQSPHAQPHPHQAPHPSPPEPRYLSRPESSLPYATAKSPYSYPHPPTASPSSHYTAPQPGSKPKVSSPAPPHIYGKPNSGIMTGTPICRASDPVVSAPLPLTSKAGGNSPYQQVPHHHGAQPPPLPPPPAHTSRSVYDSRSYAGSLPASKLPQSPLHGSPPIAAAAPLSRPLVAHPSHHHVSPHQPGQQIQVPMNATFQTQPLDLGVERSSSPKRKAPTPVDHSSQAVSLEIAKKRRTEDSQPLSLQCVGPPVLSRVSEPSPLIASAATSISTVVNAAVLIAQPNSNRTEDSRTLTSLSPAPRTDSGDGSIRPASNGSVSSLNSTTNPTSSAVPSPAQPVAVPSPASCAPGTSTKVSTITTDSEKSNSPAPRPPSTTNYPVHKLKKAWLQRHSGEDGTEDTTGVVGSGSCVMLPLKISQTPSQPLNNKETDIATTITGSTTTTTVSTNVTTSATTTTVTANSLPSAVNSIHNIGSMAVNSINKGKASNKTGRKSIVGKDTINGHTNNVKGSGVQEDSSSSDPDRKSPPKRKPPKVKRKKGAVRRQQAAAEDQRRRKEEKQVGSTAGAPASDSSNESEAGSASDASEQLTSSTQSGSRARNTGANLNNSSGNGNSKEPRKRGRRPKTSKSNEVGDEDQQPRKKKERRDDNANTSVGGGSSVSGGTGSGSGSGTAAGGNGQGSGGAVAKPTIAQLKKSGASWLQDDSCTSISRLAKCRECMATAVLPRNLDKSTFCRFYLFRRLRYTKNGLVTVAGFSDPHGDAKECDLMMQSDLSLWLPGKIQDQIQRTGEKTDKNDKESGADKTDMDLEMAHILLRQVGDQFCDLLDQELDALAQHIVEARQGTVEGTVAWKRVIKGVRELCDVCETTLFNIHWACGKCGFVVCIDCYQGRKNGTIKVWGESAKDRDDFSWIVCKNRQAHELERLMLTQIIPGDTLIRISDRLHESRAEWGIPQHCECCSIGKSIPANDTLRSLIKGDSMIVVKQECKEHDKRGNSESNGSSENKTNGEDKNSPLNWLADVALQNQEKNDSNSSSDSDEDREGNFSTLRELLIRPSHKPNGTGSRSNSPTNNSGGTGNTNATTGNSTQNNSARLGKKSKMDTLDEVISSVIEHSVKKEREGSMENDEKPRELKHFVRRYKWAQRGREPLPIRIMTLTESMSIYPDVPHSWLCDGKLLRLNDPNNPNNYRIFQDQWKRGQPVIVSDVSKSLDMDLWHPDSFARDFGNDKNDFINCMTGNLVPNQPMRKFWEGFEHFSKRLKDDRGNPMLLKLKDWPPGDDFSELLPSRFADLMKSLPLSEYTHRNGRLNLASRLPERCVRPDLGPKMYTAYGSALYPKKGTTNLHLDISDAVNVMVYVGIPKDGDNDEHVKEALRAIDEAGCDILTRRRVRERGEAPGALWHIYAARDADKIRDLLNTVSLERGARLEPHHDPIHDQSCYLDGPLRERLYREYGVEGYAIVQCLGDAVFVPAGAPHQVRNLHNCIKVAEDFVSPENVSHCFHMTQEFRALSESHINREDKLQIKNIIYHAVKDSLTVLANAKEEVLSKLKKANNDAEKEKT